MLDWVKIVDFDCWHISFILHHSLRFRIKSALLGFVTTLEKKFMLIINKIHAANSAYQFINETAFNTLAKKSYSRKCLTYKMIFVMMCEFCCEQIA